QPASCDRPRSVSAYQTLLPTDSGSTSPFSSSLRTAFKNVFELTPSTALAAFHSLLPVFAPSKVASTVRTSRSRLERNPPTGTERICPTPCEGTMTHEFPHNARTNRSGSNGG